MTSQMRRLTRKVLPKVPAIVALLLTAVTAVLLRPSIDMLLLFGIAMAGSALFGQALILWVLERVAGRSAAMLAACGLLFIGFAGIEARYMPEGPHGAIRAGLVLVMLVCLAAYLKVGTQHRIEPGTH